MSNDTKDTLSQEEINAYMASGTTNEEEGPQIQAAVPEDHESGSLSQNDIDALLKQQPEEKASPGVRQHSGAVSQNEIDKLVEQELQEQTPHADQGDSSEISPESLDVGTPQEQKKADGTEAKDPGQNESDNGPVPEQSKPSQTNEDVWEDLGGDILSQEEITALLTGMNEAEGKPAWHAGTVSEGQGTGVPDPIQNIPPVSQKSSPEIQKEKEDHIIQKKMRASAMIRGLLKTERARLATLQTRKNKMVNEELYARYEITRADRSKITVSMSEKTARQYHSSHPGCTLCKI